MGNPEWRVAVLSLLQVGGHLGANQADVVLIEGVDVGTPGGRRRFRAVGFRSQGRPGLFRPAGQLAAVVFGIQQVAGAGGAARFREMAEQGLAGYGLGQGGLHLFPGVLRVAAEGFDALQQGGVVEEFGFGQGAQGAGLLTEQPQGAQGDFQFRRILDFRQEGVKEGVGNRRGPDIGGKAVEGHR